MSKERREYEAPALVDYGTVDEVTKGNLKINIQDFPLGTGSVKPIPNPNASAPVR